MIPNRNMPGARLWQGMKKNENTEAVVNKINSFLKQKRKVDKIKFKF